ncbi:MAG TPA: hypothetical protein VG964_00745 [Candidatus Saccharimonadales bacterium]|nr:hypothetical protein [Candidatus Saccharimonadales bacterium]
MANTGEIFVAKNLLEACQGWQEVLDNTPGAEAKDVAGKAACKSLEDADGFMGTPAVIVKSELAVVLKDPSEEGPADTAIQYSNVILKGMIGRVAYMRVGGYGAITWPIYRAQVLQEPDIAAFDESSIPTLGQFEQTNGSARPVHLPVGFIDLVICAA